MQHGMSSTPVPQIVLTECNSLPTSPSEDSAETRQSDSVQTIKDNNTGNDIRVSYFSHIVRTPRLPLWKQDLSASQKVPRLQDLDAAQRELPSPVQDVTQSCPPLTSERAIKQPLRREPRVQESLEAAKETNAGRMKKLDTGLSVSPQNEPIETSQVGLIRTQGVGGEKEDICHSTYRRLDSLEETIHELELSLMEFSTDPHMGNIFPASVQTQRSSTKGSSSTRYTADGGDTNKPTVPPKPSCISTATAKVQPNPQYLLQPWPFCLFHLLSSCLVEGVWSLPLGCSSRSVCSLLQMLWKLFASSLCRNTYCVFRTINYLVSSSSLLAYSFFLLLNDFAIWLLSLVLFSSGT